MSYGIKIVEKEVFGEKVRIRTLNGGAIAAQVIELLQQVGHKPGLLPEIGALLVVGCLVDAEGRQVFSDPNQARENTALGFLSAFVPVALQVSGFAEDAEAIGKNSEAGQ